MQIGQAAQLCKGIQAKGEGPIFCLPMQKQQNQMSGELSCKQMLKARIWLQSWR